MTALFSMEASAFAPAQTTSDTTRQFNADVLEANHVVLPNTLVELWTRNLDWWHGQILYWATDQLHPGRSYVIRTATESRLVNITDIIVVGGLGAALFEQVKAPAVEDEGRTDEPKGRRRR